MDIVIVAQYLRNIEEFNTNNSRFIYLARMLEKSHSVEIITSDFIHDLKKHASNVGDLGAIKITTLHEPGYAKNVSLRRLSSHKALSKNLCKYLNERKKPDIVYCAIPSLDVAYEAAKYCQKNGVKFVVDIQDVWPEAFKMVLKIPVISDIVFAPMQKKANKIYASADEVVAVSNTYANIALRVNKKCETPVVVFLGTEKDAFDDCSKVSKKEKEGILIGYIGSMSASYDLISVIDAIAQIKCEVPVKLLAMGSGDRRDSFIEHAKKRGIDAEFTGKLPYPEMVERLVNCDIAVNPIRKGSAGSVINKVGDYAMAGLPVVNTQECREYRELLDRYNAGINCECENASDMALALEKLILDIELRKQLSINSRKLGENEFDRANSYKRILNKILGE